MKGYSEERGKAFKLDYDAESKQFVAKPVDHGFQPKQQPDNVAQKPAVKRKRVLVKKTRNSASKWQPALSPALHHP